VDGPRRGGVADAAGRVRPVEQRLERFARWQEKGVWQRLMDQLAADGDLEWVMLDSTVVRAHSCAAGAKKAKETNSLGVRGAGSPRSSTASPTASVTRFASP